MRIGQLIETLPHYLKAREPILLVGPPGVGKTDGMLQAAASLGYDVQVSHPVVEDPTYAAGYPFPAPDHESARFLPFGHLARACKATKPLLWFLDDLGQASRATQASYMQLLLGRAVGEHKLPDCVVFAAATNRRTDASGVEGILAAVLSRFATVLQVETHLDDWCAWACTQGIDPRLIAFLRLRPDLLHAFDPTKTRDMEPFPCPRTWAKLDAVLRMPLAVAVRCEAYCGTVGRGAGTEFVAFLDLWGRLPNIDGILLAPDTAPVPARSESAVLYALAAGLAYRATAQNVGRVLRYCERLREARCEEYAALCIRDTIRRHPAVQNTAEFVTLCSSEFGRELLGQAA